MFEQRAQSGKDVKQIIAELTPVLRGWGNYFRTWNPMREFKSMDAYVIEKLRYWQHWRGASESRRVQALPGISWRAWACTGCSAPWYPPEGSNSGALRLLSSRDYVQVQARRSANRGKLFYRLAQQAGAIDPAPYKSMVKCYEQAMVADYNL